MFNPPDRYPPPQAFRGAVDVTLGESSSSVVRFAAAGLTWNMKTFAFTSVKAFVGETVGGGGLLS